MSAFGRADDVMDMFFQHKFQDKIRHLQWPERGYVWIGKGEYEVIFTVTFHTVFCGLVQKTILV